MAQSTISAPPGTFNLYYALSEIKKKAVNLIVDVDRIMISPADDGDVLSFTYMENEIIEKTMNIQNLKISVTRTADEQEKGEET